MIKINRQNILKAKIGPKNGMEPAVLRELCMAKQPLVAAVLRSAGKEGYGFLKLPDNAKLLKQIQTFAAAQKKYKWENILVLGIGGSALGVTAIKEALLGCFHDVFRKPRLLVLDNVDPVFITDAAERLDMKKTLFVVISKSGTTVEPMALFALAKEKMMKTAGKNWKKHFVFITDPRVGLLREIAGNEGIAAFEVPPNVGGRYSVLSSVGLLPAALAGLDAAGLLKGAKKMRGLIAKAKGEENPALLLAALQHYFDKEKKKPMTVVMPYCNELWRVADWYRQLLAESIGKNGHSGPTPLSALGATDQHSQVQLWNEGPDNKFFIFLRVISQAADLKIGKILPKPMDFLNGKTLGRILDASYKGTSESLAKNGRPNVTLEIPKTDAETVGALFMLFEFQVALLGLMYGVNAFNQPGVEHGKQITKKILSGR
ncbi:glucose-6-phosphate isomerase [Candidatus Peregrinibacteria bacterium]|nr:glucose-6-phosphate isomerase [Candidatus Peregrinibacteria bacterium]